MGLRGHPHPFPLPGTRWIFEEWFLFFTVGSISAVLAGFLLNYFNKVNLLFILVVFGSLPAIACVFVTTFTQLVILRTLTGISIGGSYPIIFALIAEKATPQTQAVLTSLISLAMGGGAMIGQGIAGFLGDIYGWRIPFVVLKKAGTNLMARKMNEGAFDDYDHVHVKKWSMVGPRGR